MTPRRSLVGQLLLVRGVRSSWTRRAIFTVLIAVLLFLSFFPERYRAAVTLTPTDPASMGLSGTLGQLGAINSVFGNQAAVEVALKVARSIYVRETVAQQTHLMQRLHFANQVAMHRWLEKEVTIRSLRGGIIVFEMLSTDPELAKDLVSAYSSATQERLAQISRGQTQYKRDVLIKLVYDASDRLARARAAYDTFRLQTRFSDPAEATGAIAAQIPALEAAIRQKQIELNSARQLNTNRNIYVLQLQNQLGTLQSQLAQARSTSPEQSSSVGKAVRTSTQADKLYREMYIARSLYESYMRFLEGTQVEDLTSNANVRVLEPPYVDTDRQINYAYLALAIATALLWGAMEIYRVRPPAGDRVIVRETYA